VSPTCWTSERRKAISDHWDSDDHDHRFAQGAPVKCRNGKPYCILRHVTFGNFWYLTLLVDISCSIYQGSLVKNDDSHWRSNNYLFKSFQMT
jgi:hypothetical protein